MRIFITGAPGTNKFVLSVNIANRYKIPHFSYRSLVLDYMKEGTESSEKIKSLWTGSSAFPPSLAFDVVKKYIFDKEINDNYVIDGFPKGASEAELLLSYLKDKKFIFNNYTVILNERIKKVLDIMHTKWICTNCPYIIDTIDNNSLLDQKCPYCHNHLVKGDLGKDSSNEKISANYNRYKIEYPGIKLYMSQISKVIKFNGNEFQSEMINKVFNDLDKYESRNI